MSIPPNLIAVGRNISEWVDDVEQPSDNELAKIEEHLEDAAEGNIDLFKQEGGKTARQVELYLETTANLPTPALETKSQKSDDTIGMKTDIKLDHKLQEEKRTRDLPQSDVADPSMSDSTPMVPILPELSTREETILNRIKSPEHHSFTSQRETADIRARVETTELRLAQMEHLLNKFVGNQKAVGPKLNAHDGDITTLFSSYKELRSLMTSMSKQMNDQYTQLTEHLSKLAELKISGSSKSVIQSPLSSHDLPSESKLPELKESFTQKLSDSTKMKLKKRSRAERMDPDF